MLNLYRNDWDVREPQLRGVCFMSIEDLENDVKAKAQAIQNNTPFGPAKVTADIEDERKARDAITNKLNNATPGVAPTATPTNLAPVQTAQGVDPGNAPVVQKTAIGTGTQQTVAAPSIAKTAPVQATTIAAPTTAPTALANAAKVGPAATATQPSGIGVHNMAAASVGPAAQAQAAQVAQVQAATAPIVQRTALDTSQSDQVRAQQQAITAQLQAAAAGNGPSAAQALLQQQTDRAKKEQMGLAVARAHGGNVGLAQREANENIAQVDSDAIAQAAALRAKEQQDAQGRLADVLSNTRSQDISLTGKAADLASSANLTEAQLQGQTSLANLDVRSKTALTQAQIDEEAAQKNAERTQQTALTAAGFAQEAAKANAGEANLASRTTYATEAEAAQAQAARDQQVLINNAANQQAVNLLNPQEQNKMATDAAARAVEVAKANQSTGLSAATTTASLNSQETIEGAQLKAKVAMDNATRELSTLQKQAEMDQQNGIHNADLAQQIAIKQAELDQTTQQFNAGEANKLNVSQGDITSRESLADQDAILKQRALDTQRELALTSDQLAANQAPVGVAMQNGDEIERRREADQAQTTAILGSVLGAGGGVGAAAVGNPKSDERSKKDITKILSRGSDSGDELLDAFDAIQPYKFKYKDPASDGARPGERYGVMAQDLEKTPAGKSVVIEKNGEKMIDSGAAVALALAAIADMRKQMASLKKGRR